MIRRFNIQKLIVCLITLFFITEVVFISLEKGGRWDLNEQIAMADRAIVGQVYYSTEEDGFYLSSSPYFPGVSFLSFVVSKVSYENREEILLILATFIGISLLYMLVLLSQKMGANKKASYIIVLMYLVWFFDSWKYYMTEFKPDSLILLLSTGVLYSLINIEENKNKLLNFTFVFVSLIAIGVFKQQGIAIYFGMLLILIFYKAIALKDRIILLITTAAAGIIVLSIVFSIPNCFNNAVMMVKQHPIMGIKNIVAIFFLSIKNLWLFYVPLFAYFIFRLRRSDNKITKAEVIWLFLCLPWLLLSLLGAIKAGGNDGNIEAGFIPFLPFIVIFLENIYKNSAEASYAKSVLISLSFITIVLSSVNGYLKYSKSANEKKQTISYLKNNFANRTALYNGNVYTQIIKAGLIPKSEIDVALGMFGLAKQDISLFYQEIEIKGYDIIYCNTPLDSFGDKKLINNIYNNYEYCRDSTMPIFLKDKILIPKK